MATHERKKARETALKAEVGMPNTFRPTSYEMTSSLQFARLLSWVPVCLYAPFPEATYLFGRQSSSVLRCAWMGAA